MKKETFFSVIYLMAIPILFGIMCLTLMYGFKYKTLFPILLIPFELWVIKPLSISKGEREGMELRQEKIFVEIHENVYKEGTRFFFLIVMLVVTIGLMIINSRYFMGIIICLALSFFTKMQYAKFDSAIEIRHILLEEDKPCLEKMIQTYLKLLDNPYLSDKKRRGIELVIGLIMDVIQIRFGKSTTTPTL